MSHVPLQVPIMLDWELTNRNHGQGRHWAATHRERKNIEAFLRIKGLVFDPLPFPALLRITRVLGARQRFWDDDSIGRGNAKQLIDSLVECDWFFSDSPRWLRVEYKQAKPNAEVFRGQPMIELFVERLVT